MDKLRAITFFCRTVESGSFAGAAQSLDVVPSALSKVIASLESALGFKLMHRSTRRLRLTEEGQAYYDQCRQLLLDLEEAEVRARRGGTRAQGTLRIGMHPALRVLFLSKLGLYLDANPHVRVETVTTNTASAVLDEGLDVVVRIGRLEDSSLLARPLGSAGFIVCAAPSYLAVRSEPRQPEDLAEHRAIVYGRRDEEPNTRWEFCNGTDRRIVEVPVFMVSRDGVGLADAAVGGCGIARPFEYAVRHLIARGELKPLLQDWSSETLPVNAVLPPNARGLPAKVRAFLDFSEHLLAGE
jgi:DNA-binding transcriptional LysR family regulator